MNKLYVANWKMYLSHTQALEWLNKNHAELTELSAHNRLVLCPDFTVLACAHAQYPQLTLGAQNCASSQNGAFTGEIPAQSLAESGCTYCIIGHSEQRAHTQETAEAYSQKIESLSAYGLTPIYCIGENAREKDVRTVLEKQLEPALKSAHALIIAYEPVWAIGSGLTPKNSDLEPILAWIKEKTNNRYPVLYGGSVSGKTAPELKELENLDGFLIGKASTDFQELKKIVLSV